MKTKPTPFVLFLVILVVMGVVELGHRLSNFAHKPKPDLHYGNAYFTNINSNIRLTVEDANPSNYECLYLIVTNSSDDTKTVAFGPGAGASFSIKTGQVVNLIIDHTGKNYRLIHYWEWK